MRSLRRFSSRVVMVFAALTISSCLLLPVAPASANGITIDDVLRHDAGFHLDGEGLLLPMDGGFGAVIPPMPLHEMLYGKNLGVTNGPTVVLGFPGGGVVDNITDFLGDVKDGIESATNCEWFTFTKENAKNCLKTAVGAASCAVLPAAVVLQFVASDWGCLAFLKRILTQIGAWLFGKILKRLIFQINEHLRDGVEYMARYTLVEMLGKNRAGPFNFAPVVDCSNVPAKNADGSPNEAAKACAGAGGATLNSKDYWFTGQYKIMRNIGFYLIMPLLMLVAVQSIIKGSLFFLLRAVLVMLPIAVIGSVIMFTVAQVLMNIADDMALFLANKTTSPAEFGEKFSNALAQLDANSFGFFAAFWFVMMLLSMLVIFAELMLRQMGIYLTLLFMPLAFATMIYPPCIKWLKRAFSLLLGLIFMKLFIVAALSMGFAAMASSVPQATSAEEVQDVDGVINQAILGVIVLLFAGFGGTKILAFTPAADAVANRIASPGEVLGMGDFTAQQLGKYGGQVMDRVGAATQGSGSGGGVGAADPGASTAEPEQPEESGAEQPAPGQDNPGNNHTPPPPNPAKPTTNATEGQGKGVGDTIGDVAKEGASLASGGATDGAGDGGKDTTSKTDDKSKSDSNDAKGVSTDPGKRKGANGESGQGQGTDGSHSGRRADGKDQDGRDGNESRGGGHLNGFKGNEGGGGGGPSGGGGSGGGNSGGPSGGGGAPPPPPSGGGNP